MLPRIGLPEVIVVLVLALLIFGPGRITKVAGELGRGIHAFQDGLKSDDQASDRQA
ncbi:MAG: twin-arginine translocase TatA/TatE family subunit [Anaerolineae bacterium]|nr:twin-arginine translocase TatA/TatE family subunit [Anaerolineae bacterium]